MLTKVEVITETGKTLELPIQDPPEGYLVKDIEGLDPVPATLVSASFANMDGEQYHASRREKRNIVFKLGLEPDHIHGTGRELRTNLYAYFMPKTSVTLRFHDEDLGIVQIVGRVETFSCPMFVQEPEATISLVCFNPDFYEPEAVIFNGTVTDGETETLLNYTGTIETGIKFNVTVDELISGGMTIFHRAPDNSMRTFDYTANISAGYRIDISTIPGAKSVTLTSDATGTDSVLYNMAPQSNWITLQPGANYIRVYMDEYQVSLPYTIEYTNKHGGL